MVIRKIETLHDFKYERKHKGLPGKGPKKDEKKKDEQTLFDFYLNKENDNEKK